MSRLQRLRPYAITAAFGLMAFVFLGREHGLLGGGPTIIPPAARVAAITVDLKDVDITRDPNGAGRVVRSAAPAEGRDVPAAPLMDWEDDNVRTGRTEVWCLKAADPDARAIFREVLDTLSARFKPDGRSGIGWRESCGKDATYKLTGTAYDQCGIGDSAVACAGPNTYCGPTAHGDAWCGGHVSYNGHYRDYTLSGGQRGLSPGLDAAGVKVALSHEVQHLLLNLGHNSCGTVLDPVTGKAVSSVMTALYLPSGPSCSKPAAVGLAESDWVLALGYYDFGPATSSATPASTPTATATPAPPIATEPPGLPPKAHPPRTGAPGKVAPTFTAYNLAVVGAIADEADREGLPPLWVLSMGAQEGGLACPPTCPTGDLDLDSRGSCGTFQIYIAAHGGDCAYWQNPINAMREMAARWKWAYSLCNGGFLDDPHGCLITSVPQAQGSIGWTQAIASGAFRVALVAYVDLLQSRGSVVPADMAGALTVAAQGLDDIALRAAVQADALRKAAGGQ